MCPQNNNQDQRSADQTANPIGGSRFSVGRRAVVSALRRAPYAHAGQGARTGDMAKLMASQQGGRNPAPQEAIRGITK